MDAREVFTVRIPAELVARAREVKTERESLNDPIVTALDREVRHRRAWNAHTEIVRIRAKVRARTGSHPDPTPLIHTLRSGEDRRG